MAIDYYGRWSLLNVSSSVEALQETHGNQAQAARLAGIGANDAFLAAAAAGYSGA